MDVYFWTVVLVSSGTIQGFMFDQMSDGMRCKGVSMICPPMCRKYDSSGCVTCSCANINPAMPMDPSNNHNNPANPLNGGGLPGSSGCSQSWSNCACAPSVDASTGCIYCPCGTNNPQPSSSTNNNAPTTTPKQQIQTNHVASSTGAGSVTSAPSSLPTNFKTTMPPKSTQQITSTGTGSGSIAQVTSGLPSNTGQPSPIKTTMASKSTQQITTTANTVTTTSPTQSTKIVFNTKLPIVATTPAPFSVTSHPLSITTTQAAFVCPGIFNCSLDCYAGFSMDSNGCPLCQCAPIPTDLP